MTDSISVSSIVPFLSRLRSRVPGCTRSASFPTGHWVPFAIWPLFTSKPIASPSQCPFLLCPPCINRGSSKGQAFSDSSLSEEPLVPFLTQLTLFHPLRLYSVNTPSRRPSWPNPADHWASLAASLALSTLHPYLGIWSSVSCPLRWAPWGQHPV